MTIYFLIYWFILLLAVIFAASCLLISMAFAHRIYDLFFNSRRDFIEFHLSESLQYLFYAAAFLVVGLFVGGLSFLQVMT